MPTYGVSNCEMKEGRNMPRDELMSQPPWRCFTPLTWNVCEPHFPDDSPNSYFPNFCSECLHFHWLPYLINAASDEANISNFRGPNVAVTWSFHNSTIELEIHDFIRQCLELLRTQSMQGTLQLNVLHLQPCTSL